MPKAAVLLSMSALLWTGAAQAQLPMPPSTQFDINGFLQEAALDPACSTNAHCGGTLKVNGHLVTVPKETIVILPANALTWQELFAQAPAPYTGVATGMAIADFPAPLTTYEVHVVGNRVGDAYIAGLIDIAQNGLNSGAGFINFIDYNIGEMRVGGTMGSSTTGTRVRINDPSGRYGRVMTPDQRFTVDPDNPTIAAGTGFPMCFPRFAPPTVDPLCPESNRPKDALGNYQAAIQMNNPVTTPGVPPNALQQAPLEVGDYITFSGTLVKDGVNPTAGPWPLTGTAGTYVSAHTIGDNVAIYTWPGTNPAYVSTEVALIGTGGLTVLGAGEAAIRTRFEGMSTDPSRNVHLYGMDLDPATGATTDRDWGVVGVDPGPPNGAVKGRWRFRPPCVATTPSDKGCTPPPSGTFLPPTREVRAVIEGAWVPGQTKTYANGIIAGQYHAPILEYIFPENIPGSPVVPNNFESLAFLKGGYTSSAGTLAAQLNPWPNVAAPAPTCSLPTASAGGPYSVVTTKTVTLAATATGTGPFTFSWASPGAGTLSNLAIANPVYTAPLAAQLVPLSLTVTNGCGSVTVSSAVIVNTPGNPTINSIAPVTVFSGAPVSMTATGTDPNGLALTYTWLQTASTGPIVLVPNPFTGATVSFAAPTLPLGQITNDVLNFQVSAKDSAGATATPVTTSVTVKPLPDALSITLAEYRTSKFRLTVNATSSVISPNVVLTLQPYTTTTGTVFDPASIGATFTNNGGGLYIIDLVGAPQPAAGLVVKSNLGGTSAPHVLDRIRL